MENPKDADKRQSDPKESAVAPPDTEAQERIAKLRLEQKLLSLQTSGQGRAIEWLKASAGIAAIIGLAISFWAGTQQLRQLATSREEERFDRAVSRLGSMNPAERLAGVAGLQLFLTPDSARQRATLLFLVNAISVESDPTVRGAILDTFTALERFRVPKAIRDETLITARDRNRGILRNLQARFQRRMEDSDKLLFEKGNDEAWLGKLEEQELAPLQATASTIAALVRGGAYSEDLTHIYCVSCQFTSPTQAVNLPHTKFDGSYLRRASFVKVNLQEASFDNAYLLGTDFSGANLRQAKLTAPPLSDPPVQSILVQRALWAASGPIFECADLSGADFTGAVLFGFYWTDIHGVGFFPRFFGAKLTGAKLKSFKVFTALPKDRSEAVARGGPGESIGMRFQQSGSYSISVKGWKDKDYMLTTYVVSDDFAISKRLPRELWISVYPALNSLASAKNLDEAELPVALSGFIRANPQFFARPILSRTCPLD